MEAGGFGVEVEPGIEPVDGAGDDEPGRPVELGDAGVVLPPGIVELPVPLGP